MEERQKNLITIESGNEKSNFYKIYDGFFNDVLIKKMYSFPVLKNWLIPTIRKLHGSYMFVLDIYTRLYLRRIKFFLKKHVKIRFVESRILFPWCVCSECVNGTNT